MSEAFLYHDNNHVVILKSLKSADHVLSSFFRHVFKRLKFLGNKSVSHISTLVFLAVWHGLHSGYFMCFFMEFLIVMVERQVSQSRSFAFVFPIPIQRADMPVCAPLTSSSANTVIPIFTSLTLYVPSFSLSIISLIFILPFLFSVHLNTHVCQLESHRQTLTVLSYAYSVNNSIFVLSLHQINS